MADDEHTEEDPLDEIFVDGDAADRELIRDILQPYLKIDEDGGQFYPTDAYAELNSKEKILVTLAAEQAKELRDIVESPAIGPGQISELSGVKEGTVKPGVRELADEGVIRDTDDGYSVGGPQLQQVADRLLDDE